MKYLPGQPVSRNQTIKKIQYLIICNIIHYETENEGPCDAKLRRRFNSNVKEIDCKY